MFDFFDQLEALERPVVTQKPWMKEKTMLRVTPEMLTGVVDQCIASGLYAVDLETSGLDNRVYNGRTRDYIVGCCLSPDGEIGYYIPVRHMNHISACVPVSQFESEMRRLFASNAIAIFHNGKFDQEFFQFPGGEPMSEFDDPKKWEDTLILAYLRDTHAKNKGLKFLSKNMLNMEMIELEDLFTKEQLNEHGHNFGVLDPTWEPSVWYGASDAICTYLLYHRLRDEAILPFEGKNGVRCPVGSGGTYVPSQETIYTIEKLDITAVRWMERCRIPINRDTVAELIRIGQRDWLPALQDVYSEASKALGRDITPGYVRLLSDPKSEYYFDTEIVGMSPDVPGSDGVDTTLMGRVDRARVAAAKLNMDPVEVVDRKKTKIQTLPKSVPKVTDPSHMEIVEFPLVYDVLLPEQLGLLLRELGVDGLIVTEKSGQIKTSKDELDKVIENAGEKFPFIGKIKRFREVAKALASNLQPIYDDTHPERSPDSTIRVNFEPLKTDTGRFSTPAPKESRGFHGTVRWNLQSIPAAYDTKKPECMLRLREVICAPPDSVIVACIAEAQEVLTDRGLVRIRDVRVGDSVYYDGGSGQVTSVQDNGVKDIVRLQTNNGYSVDCTPDHRVMVWNQSGMSWKQAGLLGEGDWVVLPVQSPSHVEWADLPPIEAGRHYAPNKMNAELAEFFGRVMGDGCITGSRGVLSTLSMSLGLELHEHKEALAEQMQRWFGITTHSFTTKGDVRFYSKTVASWLDKVLNKKSVFDLEIPSCVLQSNIDAHRAFLRGLFDADGYVSARTGDGVSLWVSSEKMSQQVQTLLLQDGILSRRVKTTRKTNFKEHTGYAISIRGRRAIESFQKNIGLITQRKKENLAKIAYQKVASDAIPYGLALQLLDNPPAKERLQLRNAIRYDSMSYEQLRNLRGDILPHLRFDRVVSVTPMGKSRVYDLTVPDGSRFAVNGIVVHNCDYSGQELRLATNFSTEPKWVNEFFRCSDCDYEFDRGGLTPPPPEPPPTFCPRCGSDKIGDLHSLTALSIFGEEIREDKKLFKAKRQSSKCVHPDTLIIHDGRLVPIRSLPFGDVDTFMPAGGSIQGQHGPIPLLESYNGGRKMLYHVVTTRGVVTCSENHPFLTVDGLKSIQDGLKVGDPLVDCDPVCVEDHPYEAISIKLHEDVPALEYTPNHDMSYFAGMYHGDGSKAGDRCIVVTHGNTSKTDVMGVSYQTWQDKIIEAVENAGLRGVRKRESVYVGSRNTIRFLEALELHDTVGRRRLRIPTWVMKAGRNAILSYLAGLLDTDGMVTVKDGCGKICTKDLVFAGQIAAALRAIGVVPRVDPSWNKTYQRYYWVVNITTKGMFDLSTYMKHPGKLARVRKLRQSNAFKVNQVKLILPFEEHQCYDVHVGDPSHTFWCNGVVTHNSLNFAMVYGGGGSAAQRAIGCSKDEGWRIKHQFDKTYKTLSAWWKKMHEFARATGVVLTAFNRRIYLPDINHPDGGFRSKAERNATNGPIQGCLHGDCRISTREGLMRMSDLMDRGTDFDVWTGVSWQRARPMFSGQKKHCVTHLSDGLDIHTSPDHMFRVYRNGLCWVRQEDLQVGDWVLRDQASHEYAPKSYTFERKYIHPFSFNGNTHVLWELIGRVIGDGSMNHDGVSVHFGTSVIDGKEYSARSAAEAFRDYLSPLNLPVLLKDKIRPGRRDMCILHVYSKAFNDFLQQEIQLTFGNTYTKTFPGAIWSESVANRAAFLRGYFDTDGTISSKGDMISVRSVNQKLLRDTYLLLNSIGVKATYTRKCLRVSVIDRIAYRNIIGFQTPHKAARLEKMRVTSQMYRSTMLPEQLISEVGHKLGGLPQYFGSGSTQAFVANMKKGLGSRHSFEKVAASLGYDLSPYKDVMSYGYSQVVKKEDLQEYIPMYDIEVFDEDHAFSCDGVIVHNSGSDIMKLAMGMLYKEYKRRGWLDKVKVIITIHDELVFVIPKALLAEVVPVTKEIMIRKTIAKMPWRVPLTCDVEAGPDWSVPWNLTKIEYGKEPMPPELAPYLSHIVKAKEGEPVKAVEPYILQIPMEMLSEDTLAYLAEMLAQIRPGEIPAYIKITETDETLWEGTIESVEMMKELMAHEDN